MSKKSNFITIQDILSIKGALDTSKTLLVKHATNEYDLYTAYLNKREDFLNYQCHQSKDVFKGAEYIVSFIGEGGNRVRFIGVFKVCDVTPLSEAQIDHLSSKPYNYLYTLEEDMRFADLKDRIMVDWGTSRIWHQKYGIEKEIIEILQGLHYRQFSDYLSFILSFRELEEIIINKYRDWKRALENVNCIYMIAYSFNKKQYIGSTSGAGGIWSRWTDYVKTNGTGGNKLLIECSKNDPNYTEHITFTILEILPRTISSQQAVDKENLFKKKLGSRAIGLNSN